MKKKFLAGIGIALSMALLLTACGSGNKNYVSEMAADSSYYDAGDYSDYEYDYSLDVAEETADESYNGDFGTTSGTQADSVSDSASVSSQNKVDTNRKLIKTVDLDVETKEFDALVAAIENQVTAYNGYVESQNTWNGSRYDYYGNESTYSNRNANYTIRVPRENLEAFLNSFSELCNIKNKSESVQDITLSYVDLESHKKALETEEERLLALMEKAEEMYDILTIEDKLTDIRYQMQSMESQLRTYDNKVTYSTVTMYIQEVRELTYDEPEPETFWDRLTSNFEDSIEALVEGLKNFAIFFVAALPHLLIWGGIIFGIVMAIRGIVRFNIKKNRKRREEEAKKATATVYTQTVSPQAAPGQAAPGQAASSQAASSQAAPQGSVPEQK
ncbi:MAG: DUF4349 domain-containing protein [Lachnospiraceae bacterium]|nr:DUF4349 domain-containing protein [Lachnospiraceae bacterium]